jgi:hypothetical protein
MRTILIRLKKIAPGILGCFTFLSVQAQVQIQTALPTVGLVQKNQLWNLVLVNASPVAEYGRLEMVVTNRRTNQELLTATTAEFLLKKGATAVNVNLLNPILYNYIGIDPDKTINTLLPAGAYAVCYQFVSNAFTDKRQALAEECTQFDTEPLSPPLLSFPADSAVLETSPTQFAWLPPTPVAMINDLHYEVLITEIFVGQEAAEALQLNSPLFSNVQGANNFMTYSAAYPVFEKDKWYAWQVIARDNMEYAGKSEVWVFKVAVASPAQQAANSTPYTELQQTGAGKTVAPNGLLRFSYTNQLADTEVKITVTDAGDKANDEVKQFVMKVERGQNFLQKDISKLFKYEEGHTYRLMLENSIGEKWYLLFAIKNY